MNELPKFVYDSPTGEIFFNIENLARTRKKGKSVLNPEEVFISVQFTEKLEHRQIEFTCQHLSPQETKRFLAWAAAHYKEIYER